MATAATVKALFRYPVKSMGGESLAQLSVGSQGVPGDRAWAVRDEVLGGIRGGKRFADLMRCSARYLDEPEPQGSSPAQITLPNGATLMTGDETADGQLTELVGNPVTLWPLMPAADLEHYVRGAPVLDDLEAELRRIFARLPDEPLPDLSVFPPELMRYESPIGTYFDAYPLLVLTQQSLDTLAGLAPGHRFDARRFRPNILLDVDAARGLPEHAWEGRRLTIGTATLRLEIRCPRCVMTTHGFADLPKDPGVMRALVQHTGGDLGIYASVVESGEFAVGDRVALQDP